VKRKNSTEISANAKSPRMDAEECPHLKVINETKGTIAKVLDCMSEYTGNDPILANNIYALATCMNSFNDILGTVMAERLIPGKSLDACSGDEDCEVVSESCSNFLFPPPPPTAGNLSSSNLWVIRNHGQLLLAATQKDHNR
jgi:hypothetical protein